MKNPYLSYTYYPLVVAFGLLLSGILPIPEKSPVTFDQEKITIKTATGKYHYDVEVAINEAQQERGLMYRTSLTDYKGMLFIFSGDNKVSMWMKNTLISLDMLFIDKLGKIVYIAKNAKPDSLDIISPGDAPVIAVLELKGGSSEAHNINIGDEVIYKAVTK